MLMFLQTGDTGAGGWFVDFCSVAASAALAAVTDGSGEDGEREKVRLHGPYCRHPLKLYKLANYN